MELKKVLGPPGEIPMNQGAPGKAYAKKALHDYHRHRNKFILPNGSTLKGFSFDRQDLVDMLTQVEADRVMFAFGYHDGTLDAPEGFTLIMIGIEEVGGAYNLMIDDNVHKLFDYCEPCPTKCTVPDLDSF